MKAGVVDLLIHEGGYRRVPEPLHVADLDFEFGAVLVGPPSNPGLVVVLDEPGVSPESAIRRLRAFNRVLSRSGVRRPITTVLLNPEMAHPSLEELRAVSRVLVADSSSNIASVLRPLLPLELPEPTGARRTVSEVLEDHLPKDKRSSLARKLVGAGDKGADKVRNVIRRHVAEVSQAGLQAARDVGHD